LECQEYVWPKMPCLKTTFHGDAIKQKGLHMWLGVWITSWITTL